MTLSTVQVAQLLTTTAVVILAAHALGYLFAKLRQPAVIGEIVAGLLLGPTLLGLVAPQLKAGLFPATGPTSVALGTLGQFGLLLLMFVTGGTRRMWPSWAASMALARRRMAASWMVAFCSSGRRSRNALCFLVGRDPR